MYEQVFEVVGHHSTWPPYHEPTIHPNLKLKSTMKERPKSTYFLNEMNIREMWGLKHCGMYGSEGYSHRQYPHKVRSSS